MKELIFNNLKQGYRTSYLFHFAIIFFCELFKEIYRDGDKSGG